MPKPPVIAIVDDDAAVREALCDLLQVEGLSARAFANGAGLLAEDDVHSLQCVITDVRMPEVDGLELQRRLRAQGSSAAVIFITSSTDPATREIALRGGAAGWFAKPVDDEALLRTLRGVLAREGREPRDD